MREDDLPPELDDDDRALVAKLRELPPDGEEPDWRVLEAGIRGAVGDAMPRPWWRNWRIIIPVWTVAMAAAVIALVVFRAPGPAPVEPNPLTMHAQQDAGVTEERVAAGTLWLDGEALELDDVEGHALDTLDADVRGVLAIGDEGDDTALLPTAHDEGDDTALLPTTDYGWVDALDDDELARAEAWLARKRS